jgi:hypothetical protein
MALPKDFANQLSLKSDTEVYDILAHAEDYLPEALEAAKAELSKRNLPAERVAELEAAVQSERATEGAKADERLGWPMRILIFFLCAGVPGALLAVYYANNGYRAKAKDCWITMGVSIAAHVVLSVMVLR